MEMTGARDAQWTALTAAVATLEAKAAETEARLLVSEAAMQASDARAAALERILRFDRIRSFAGLIVCMSLSFLGALAWQGHAQTTPQTLVCKDIKVVGDDGKTRVEINSDSDGGSLATYNVANKVSVYLGSDDETHDGYFATYRSATGKELVHIASLEGSDDGSITTFSGATGKQLIHLSASDDTNDGSIFTYSGKSGKELIGLTSTSSGNGAIQINDKDGSSLKVLP